MKKMFIWLLITSLGFSCTKNDTGTTIGVTTGTGGSLAKYTIIGNYLYTVDESSLKVFDIDNAKNPIQKTTVNVGFGIETIYPFNDKLFIGSTSFIYIYSVANPLEPKLLSVASSQQVMRRCDPVVAKDSVAYATLRGSGLCGGNRSILAIYNIKDITYPQEVFSITMKEPMGLGYWGNTLYVCDTIKGLSVFDISNPYLPLLATTLTNEKAYDVIPYNDELICWTSTGLVIYDITSRNNPIKIATIQ